jgi:uncharacterized protein
VDISFDPVKNARNRDLHGIALERAMDFEWQDALIIEDTRHDYGEQRFVAFGRIDSRLHVLVHTPRAGRAHVISLRRANKRERRRYEDETKGQASSEGSG